MDLTPNELAWALLEDMQAREHDPIAGVANRDLLANSFTPFSSRPNPQQHEVMNRINKAARNGFALLERWDGFVTSTALATVLGNIMPTEPEIRPQKCLLNRTVYGRTVISDVHNISSCQHDDELASLAQQKRRGAKTSLTDEACCG